MVKTIRNLKFIARGLVFAFLVNSLEILPLAQAQDFILPAPGTMVSLSPVFAPPLLKGIKVHPDNPFRFEFILDKGDSHLGNDQLKQESSRLVKYFLASLTIPEKDLWVNLSPYERNRIVPESFGRTEMGRDLLAEDYMLKQITASLIYPEGETGKKFWQIIYAQAAKRFGTTNIPVNTFNKVWIVPEKAVVYENAKAGTAYVVASRLKVMLEEDYLSLQKHEGIQFEQARIKGTNQLGSQVVREIVIPELAKEVNEDKNFSQLRQVYNSLILATWYKKKIKDSILEQVYTNKNKIAGVNIDDPQEKERIYQRYLQAFKKGAYNYIKEEIDPLTQVTTPRKYFSGGEELINVDAAMLYTSRLPSDPVADKAILSVNIEGADQAMTADEIRKHIFGGNIDAWLSKYNKNGKKELMEDTIESLLKDPEFTGILRTVAKDDTTKEIIRYAVRNDINLQTRSLSIFLNTLNKSAKEMRLRVLAFSMPISSYVQFLTALNDERVQAYLDSEEFKEIPAGEKLVGIVGKIKELKLTLESDNLGHIYSALPQKLSKKVAKKDVQKIELPMAVYEQLIVALNDERVQAYLDSEEFKEIPAGEKLVGIVGKIKELKLTLESDNLGQIYSALPQKLSKKVAKKDVQLVQLPMAVYEQLIVALNDERVQAYLDSEEFKEIPAGEKLVGIVGKIKELKLTLESDNLGHIYSALPQKLSKKVAKKDVQLVQLPMAVYEQLIVALNDERVQAYLDSEEFKEIPAGEKLVGIVGKIKELKLTLESDNLGQIYSALPQKLSKKVAKKDVQLVQLPMAVYEQLIVALNDERVQAYLDSEEFKEIPAGEKLVGIVGKIKELKLTLESDNLGQIYSALPQKLSKKVAKKDVQLVQLPMAVYEQLIVALNDERVQAYLDSEEFKEIPAGEKLVGIVGKIKELKLTLESDNLGHIYSALPQKLSKKVAKKDVQLVQLPMAVYEQLIVALNDERVQAYLDSEEFKEIPAGEKLVGIVGKIKELKLTLESDNLGHIYSALPQKLSKKVAKKDVQLVQLPMAVYEQLIVALNDERVQAYLDSEEFKEIPAGEKLVGIVGKIKELKLTLESDNLGHIYSALPQKLSKKVAKKDVQLVQLPMAVYEQLIVALNDERVQAYLDSEEFKEIPAGEKLVGIVGKIKELKLTLESDNLGHIYSALPQKLSKKVAKKDVQLVQLPMAVYEQLIVALNDERVQAYLDSEEFKEIPAGEKLVGIVGKIKELKLTLESDNLGQIYSALPQKLSKKVAKKDVQLVQLPMAVYEQLIVALNDERVQAYLDKYDKQTKWKRLWAGDLLKKINELGFQIKTSPLAFYSGLPLNIRRFVVPVNRNYYTDSDGILVIKIYRSAYRVYNFSNQLSLRNLYMNLNVVPVWNTSGIEAFEVENGRGSISIKVSEVIETGVPVMQTATQYRGEEVWHEVVSNDRKIEDVVEIRDWTRKLEAVIRNYNGTVLDASIAEYMDFLVSISELKNEQGVSMDEILRTAVIESGLDVGKAEDFLKYLISPNILSQGINIKAVLSKEMINYLEKDKAMIGQAEKNITTPGGIDLTSADMNLQTQSTNGDIIFRINPAMLAKFQNTPGFVPVVISVQPLKSLQQFLAG